MNVLIVFGSQFGTTEHLARTIGAALEPDHEVRVMGAKEARDEPGAGVDLLFVGAPTQMHGLRLLVRPFLRELVELGFGGVPAVAFDTRMEGAGDGSGTEARIIADRLESAGCRLVVPPEGFTVAGFTGPLAAGEEERARAWARSVIETLMAAPAAKPLMAASVR